MVNSIRFSGLASGMDTQAMVEAMLRVDRIPLDKLKQKKQLLEWKRDDYREMNLLLKELDDTIFNTIYRKGNVVKKAVSSSNSNIVTATANADAANVNFTIENVKLATAARKLSEDKISGDTKIDPTKSIWSQRDHFQNKDFPWKKENVTDIFTVPKDGGSEFQLKRTAFSLEIQGADEISVPVEKITVGDKDFEIVTNKDDLAEGKVFIDESTGKIIFGEKLEGEQSFEITYTSHYLEFAVRTYDKQGSPNDKVIKINGDTSLNNMFSTINHSNAGINMFYDSGSDKVVATRTETGNFNVDGDEFFFLNVDENGNVTDDGHVFFTDFLGLGEDMAGTGTDATFTINGLETTRKSNNFTINGVTFQLHKNTAEGEQVTINIQTDTDAIIDTIKEFVNKYNEVIDKINKKLQEERYRDYDPLTDEEREALSDKEIERWEEKARSGMLRRDPLLMTALDKLRFNFYGEVVANEITRTNPNYNQIAEIGISTSTNYLDRGKLEMDEDKLRKAIEDDPNAVFQLFMADGDNDNEKGIARRLRSTIDSTIKSIEERAGNSYKTAHSYTIGRQLLDYDDQISRYEARLSAAETRYWNQFNAMEKALQELNNQSNMLYSYLGMSMQG